MPLWVDFFDRRALCAYYCAPMADTRIPDYVDARKIFAQTAEISGSMPIAGFERFRQQLTSERGEVTFTLNFGIDAEYRRVISGAVSANVDVLCQRCLEPVAIDLADTFALALVESEEQAARLPAQLDPWMAPADGRLLLADILEEQLILCMPIVSYHNVDCTPANTASARDESNDTTRGSKPSPFAVLRDLKKPD